MKFLAIAVATAFISQSAIAETLSYQCNMTKRDSHGWIAPEYAFRVDTSTGKAQAASNHHDWTKANFKNRKKNYRVIWIAGLKSTERQTLQVRYTAHIDKATNALTVRGSFANTNASNKPYGVGKCVPSK